MADVFASYSAGLESPASRAEEVVADTPFEATCRGIYVGTFGDLQVTTAGGDTVTFKDALGLIPIRATVVVAEGTTATDIVALW